MSTTKRRVPRRELEALAAQAETNVQPRFRDFPANVREAFAFVEEQPPAPSARNRKARKKPA